MPASIATSFSKSRRSRGSPPVRRTFFDAERDEDARETRDLLEAEQLVARQEDVVAAEDLLRHAVGAAEVAAVRDRDAQVVQRPPELVQHLHAKSLARRLGLGHSSRRAPARGRRGPYSRAMRSIDRVLPDYDVNEIHHVDLPGPAERAVELALALPLASDPVVRRLLRLRGLGTSGTISSALAGMRFEELARTPTEIVVGFAGRPWRPRGGVRPFARRGRAWSVSSRTSAPSRRPAGRG